MCILGVNNLAHHQCAWPRQNGSQGSISDDDLYKYLGWTARFPDVVCVENCNGILRRAKMQLGDVSFGRGFAFPASVYQTELGNVTMNISN